jgi:membrane protease YdiL (CAAX protease family)
VPAVDQWWRVPRPAARTALGEFFDFPFVRLAAGFVLLNWVARWVAAALRGPLYALCDAVAGLWGAAYPDLGYPRLPEAVAAVVAPTALYWTFVRLSERRAVRELGGGWRGLVEGAAGLALGAGLCGAVVLALALTGAYDVLGSSEWVVVQWSLPAAAVAFREEQLFRGVIQRISEERLGSWPALGLAAAWFGLAHADNPGAGLFDGLMIALFGGALLGACYLVTRRLWLAIGVHAAWNFVEGGVFGVPVSGYDIPGLLRASVSGSRWLTGGTFGPESSLVTLAVCGGASVVLLLLARRRGHLLPPRLRRR